MNSEMIPHSPLTGLIGAKTGLQSKLYPNGECVVYKARGFKPAPMPRPHQYDEAGLYCACMRAYGTLAPALLAGLVPLGSSPLPIFDNGSPLGVVVEFNRRRTRTVKGLKGITAYGARMVRNTAHLLESSTHVGRCVFATTTLPDLPVEELSLLHENWHKVVELYRLGLKRALQEEGLTGETVTVSEIQEKRHDRTGLPVLHLHSVFVGVTRSGKFAITTKKHDALWFAAVRSQVSIIWGEISTACNLQRVKKSAAGYLGKYISKGSKAVTRAVADGFGGWMPKHWWNATRSLTRRVKAETRPINEFADWLNDMAQTEGAGVWEWHKNVSIEMRSGDKVIMAVYGRLSIRQTAEIQAYYSS